jgi:serine/threonine protein kinase
MDRIDKKVNCRDHISWDQFSNVTCLSSGTNSNIFIADLFDVKVVIKMIKQDLEYNELVRKEFDIEYWMLSRVSHPNIIKVIGSGESPRKFIVLEYLSGGTLKRLLEEKPGKSLLSMFSNTGIPLKDVLEYAKSLASALDHLHREVCIGATVIHRGLSSIGAKRSSSLSTSTAHRFHYHHRPIHRLQI